MPSGLNAGDSLPNLLGLVLLQGFADCCDEVERVLPRAEHEVVAAEAGNDGDEPPLVVLGSHEPLVLELLTDILLECRRVWAENEALDLCHLEGLVRAGDKVESLEVRLQLGEDAANARLWLLTRLPLLLLREDTAPGERDLSSPVRESDCPLKLRQVVVVEERRLDLRGRVPLEGHPRHGFVNDLLLRVLMIGL